MYIVVSFNYPVESFHRSLNALLVTPVLSGRNIVLLLQMSSTVAKHLSLAPRWFEFEYCRYRQKSRCWVFHILRVQHSLQHECTLQYNVHQCFTVVLWASLLSYENSWVMESALTFQEGDNTVALITIALNKSSASCCCCCCCCCYCSNSINAAVVIWCCWHCSNQIYDACWFSYTWYLLGFLLKCHKRRLIRNNITNYSNNNNNIWRGISRRFIFSLINVHFHEQ